MRKIAKWTVIVWSLLAICGICAGLISVSSELSNLDTDFELFGGSIGLACGLGIWLLIWLAIAGPALVIYLVSDKEETTKVEIIQPKRKGDDHEK